MKQVNLFGNEFKQDENEKKYSSKIDAPIYEPKNVKPTEERDEICEMCSA